MRVETLIKLTSRPSFDKNFRLVKAFFKGIAVAMGEKNNAE